MMTIPVSESSSESVASMNDVSRLNREESVKKSQTFSNVRFGFLELFCDDFQLFFSYLCALGNLTL